MTRSDSSLSENSSLSLTCQEVDTSTLEATTWSSTPRTISQLKDGSTVRRHELFRTSEEELGLLTSTVQEDQETCRSGAPILDGGRCSDITTIS